MKPGVTCLSKMSGRDLLTKEQTIRMDIAYIRNMSTAMDLKILWATFWSVINRRNVFGRNSNNARDSWLDIWKDAAEHCGEPCKKQARKWFSRWEAEHDRRLRVDRKGIYSGRCECSWWYVRLCGRGFQFGVQGRARVPARARETRCSLAGCGPSDRIVYFSTCSIEDPSAQDSEYVKHKIRMENRVRERESYLILRLPQVAGKRRIRTPC